MFRLKKLFNCLLYVSAIVYFENVASTRISRTTGNKKAGEERIPSLLTTDFARIILRRLLRVDVECH